jgi:hypothetical protein
LPGLSFRATPNWFRSKVTLKLGPFAHKTDLQAQASLHGYVEATLVLKVK